ncbi:hypothetical protein CK203_020984 [Vitis vinifera]|uniref:Uncharacterized protein n=1 Tax=Vitis vinifera TaxID=29760 RepID=A0A438JWU9_VITVI|nr:hypothetical protein CK203_020984 [Vitis vinifera]
MGTRSSSSSLAFSSSSSMVKYFQKLWKLECTVSYNSSPCSFRGKGRNNRGSTVVLSGLGTMKCKVEKFEVEKKSFQVKFEGSNGGTWVSVTERSRGFVVSVGFGREEVDWLTEHLKKAVELENTRGFTRKFRGENKIHLMEICFNNRGRFMKITEIATRRNPLLLVIPEGDKGSGWEVLRRAILSVQDYSDQVGEERERRCLAIIR